MKEQLIDKMALTSIEGRRSLPGLHRSIINRRLHSDTQEPVQEVSAPSGTIYRKWGNAL